MKTWLIRIILSEIKWLFFNKGLVYGRTGGNHYTDSLEANIELSDIGYLMSLTGNAEINNYTINKFKKQFGEQGSLRLVSSDEMNDPENNPKEGLFRMRMIL